MRPFRKTHDLLPSASGRPASRPVPRPLPARPSVAYRPVVHAELYLLANAGNGARNTVPTSRPPGLSADTPAAAKAVAAIDTSPPELPAASESTPTTYTLPSMGRLMPFPVPVAAPSLCLAGLLMLVPLVPAVRPPAAAASLAPLPFP